MFTYPQIDPVFFQIGPVAIRWYGVMYLIGFCLAWVLAIIRAKKTNGEWDNQQIETMLFYSMLGVIAGGRIGYMFFYNFNDLIADPTTLFMIWQGGMSFHGGLIGVLIAVWFFSHSHHKRLGDSLDFLAPLVPLGLAAGRIGNFINGELWGRVTTMPWGMIFPNVGDESRHPSQLYEFFLEGIVLFIIVWLFSSTPRPRYAVSGLFAVCYGVFRFFLEFFREPDVQIGYIASNWLTMGQLLSLPLILVGIYFLWHAYHNPILAYRKKLDKEEE